MGAAISARAHLKVHQRVAAHSCAATQIIKIRHTEKIWRRSVFVDHYRDVHTFSRDILIRIFCDISLSLDTIDWYLITLITLLRSILLKKKLLS